MINLLGWLCLDSQSTKIIKEMLHNKEIELLLFGLDNHSIISPLILQEIIMLFKIFNMDKCWMDNGIMFGMDIRDLIRQEKFKDT